jgi:16S rRNA C1402 (ribose-2'-O) methylase RsmI
MTKSLKQKVEKIIQKQETSVFYVDTDKRADQILSTILTHLEKKIEKEVGLFPEITRVVDRLIEQEAGSLGYKDGLAKGSRHTLSEVKSILRKELGK